MGRIGELRRSPPLALLVTYGVATVIAIVAGFFLTMLGALGGAGAFVVFGALALLSLAVVYRYAPETKGRQLEDIRHFWENGGRWPEHEPEPAWR